MRRNIFMVPFMFAAALLIATSAGAAELSAAYLKGTWTIDDAKNCGLKEFEHLTFRENGTMDAVRFGAVNIVGFWRQNGDLIDVHVVTSPAYLDKALGHFQGRYDYFQATMLTFDLEVNSFHAVGRIGEHMQKAVLHRCG